MSCQGVNWLSDLLLYALDRDINFWDTAFQYNTYSHIKEALKQVNRKDIVLATKLATADENETINDFDITLRNLNTDYVDVCLLHGVRTDMELKMRSGALMAMLKLKEEGKIRAVGLSSHGLGALKSVLNMLAEECSLHSCSTLFLLDMENELNCGNSHDSIISMFFTLHP